MIFKSFDSFITESNSARLLPINEYGNKKDRFDVTQNTPDYDETKNLSISAVYTGMQKLVSKEGVINLAKGFAQHQLPAQRAVIYELEQMNAEKEPSVIIFIKEKMIRQRTVINNNILFDFDLFIKKRTYGFKSDAEIQKMKRLGKVPYMTIKPPGAFLKTDVVDIWDIKDMESLKSTKGDNVSTTDQTAKKEDGKNLNPNPDAKKDNLSKGGGVGGSNIGVVTQAFPVVTGSIKGQASEPIRELQKMIMAGAIAYPNDQKYLDAANAVKNSGGFDATYGGKTALAIGILTGTAIDPSTKKNTAVTTIDQDVATKLTAALVNVTPDHIKTIVDQSAAVKKVKPDGSKSTKQTDGNNKVKTGKNTGKKIKIK